MEPLVSVISPCYNGEAYVGRFLDSIISQNYSNIEVIIINDGSKDKTEDVIFSYNKKIEERGYKLCYIYQENGGQSAAINQGLRIFQGKYMTWVDSDDVLTPDAISTKVAFMENNPTVGLSICKIKVVDYLTDKVIGEQVRYQPKERETFFYDLILGKNVFYTPGGYFVRSDMFKDAMPKPLQIEAPREVGQNFQLLLPISYKYPIGYIDKYLFRYSVRQGSHSHVKQSFEERKQILQISYRVLSNIINQISFKCPSDERAAIKAIEERIITKELVLLKDFKRKDNVKKIEKKIKEHGIKCKSCYIMIFEIKYPWICLIIGFFRKIKNKIRL